MMFPPVLAAAIGGLSFLLALAFRRHRAAQVLLALTLSMFGLSGTAIVGADVDARASAAVLMFLPWILLAAMLMPEPPLKSRRMLAFLGLLLVPVWLTTSAPVHVWTALQDTLPLGVMSWRPSRVALCLVLLASMVGVVRALRSGAAMELGLALGLVAVASGCLDLAGLGLSRWLAVAALIVGMLVLQSSWRLAFVDALTGLPNRRALDETLARLSGNYALAMVDVDHFKLFNDTHGHDAGDRVLAEVARVLARTRGASAFRFGGEEFCLLFRTPQHAADACEETRQQIEDLAVRLPRKPVAKSAKKPAGKGKGKKPVERSVKVTASIGVAARDASRRDATDILKAADQSLYKAKGKGRNQVVEA
ncbi:MAG: GGDEF domain-containing protein [Tahibacter sp.]